MWMGVSWACDDGVTVVVGLGGAELGGLPIAAHCRHPPAAPALVSAPRSHEPAGRPPPPRRVAPCCSCLAQVHIQGTLERVALAQQIIEDKVQEVMAMRVGAGTHNGP